MGGRLCKWLLLAVVRDLGADRVLEIRSAEGELQRTLFRTSGAIWFARISPDDTKVAFVHLPFRGDSTGEIQIAAIDGSGSKVLTRRFEQCAGLDWNAKTGEIWFSASTRTAYGSGISGRSALRENFARVTSCPTSSLSRAFRALEIVFS